MKVEQNFPTYESPDAKLKKDINQQLSVLLEKGTRLADVVEILDAREFLKQIETKKGQPPVVHFDVDNFVKKRISENRKISLPEEYTKIGEVILPPSEMEMRAGSGSGFKETGIILRSTMLMEVLAELDLKYSVIEGKNDPKMVRKLSYLIFTLPSIGKLVFVNDEEGNATFIVHKAEPEEWKKYMEMTKEELSEMPCGVVSSVNYPNKNKENHQEKWKNKIKHLVSADPKELMNKERLVPEGWLVAYSVAKLIGGVTNITVQRIAEQFRMDHPEWFRKYKSPRHQGGRILEYYSPELVAKIQDDYKKTGSAPEGWRTGNSLVEEIKVFPMTIQRYASKYKEKHPDWFRVCKNVQGKEIEHYSPELVEIIIKKFKEAEFAPEGWVTAHTLSSKIGMDGVTIKKYTEEYRNNHPEFFKLLRTSTGTGPFREHYSPELAEILLKKYGQLQLAPSDWHTKTSLIKTFGTQSSTLKHELEAHRISHPQWIKEYKNSAGRSREYYSPELVEYLRKKIIEEIPENWLTVSQLAKESGDITPNAIWYFVNKYENEKPEWFKVRRIGGGKQIKFFHPDLVKLIRDKYKENKPAPNGWIVSRQLAKIIGVDQKTSKKHAEVYRISNPGWFKNFKDQGGQIREHYSPELAEILKKEITKK